MAWNKSSENGEAVSRPLQKRKGFRFPVRGAIAGAIVVVGAGIAAWWLWPDSKPPQSPSPLTSTSTSLIKEATPAAAPKSPVEEKKKVAAAKSAEPVVKPYWDTNKWELQSGHLVPKGARLVKSYLTNKVERIFKYTTDDTILAYLAPQPDGALPPMQPIMGRSDEIFLKSLKDPVIIDEGDSEQVREWKELVTVARAQIKERMDAGEKFADILKDNYKLMQENQKIRHDAQKELNQIYRSGDLEGAKKYKRVMDVALQQMGIDELGDPSVNRKKARRQQNEEEH